MKKHRIYLRLMEIKYGHNLTSKMMRAHEKLRILGILRNMNPFPHGWLKNTLPDYNTCC